MSGRVVAAARASGEAAHGPCRDVDELVGRQRAGVAVVGRPLGVLDAEVGVVGGGRGQARRGAVVLRAVRVDADAGRRGLAPLARRCIRRPSRGRRARRSRATAGVQMPTSWLQVRCSYGRQDGRPRRLRQRTRSMRPKRQTASRAVAERGERGLVVAHHERFAVAEETDARELVRRLGIGGDGQRRQTRRQLPAGTSPANRRCGAAARTATAGAARCRRRA